MLLRPRRFAALLAAALLGTFAHPQDEAAPTPPTPNFQMNANLVVLDVVATDEQGNPVRGLKASDFTVLENGRPQPVSIFQPHDYDANGDAGAQPIMPHLGPGVFTNYTPEPTNGAMNILLFDVLDTRMSDWEFARAQAEKYLEESPLDGRMAVFALTARLRELQSFTSNRSRLTAALDSQALNDLWKDQYSTAGPWVLGNHEGSSGTQSGPGSRDYRQMMYLDRQSSSIAMVNELAAYLNGLPGRKNLLWIADDFPSYIDALAGDTLMPMDSLLEPEVRQLEEVMRQSQIAIYPIDAHGLEVGPIGKGQTRFFLELGRRQATMNELAEGTGGHAFYNSNGIRQAIQQAVKDGSSYYTIAYAPGDHRWNGQYRNIRVKVDRSGLSLAYRHGYHAVAPNSPGSGLLESNASAVQPDAAKGGATSMDAAMAWGSPGPTQILFVVRVSPLADGETTLAPDNVSVGKVKGGYRRYVIDYYLDQRQIACTPAPGGCSRKFNTRACVYDAMGRVSVVFRGGVQQPAIAAGEKEPSRPIAHTRLILSVPAKGDHFLRIGVRDPATNNIGALEVPVAAVGKLPAVKTAGSPASSTACKPQ